MKIGLTIAIYILFSMALQAQDIDVQKSKVNFSISNMRWNTVEGVFTGMKGNVNFDKADLANAQFNVCVDAASVNTNSGKRDENLRKVDFFDVENYPEICFTSTSIRSTSEGFMTKGKLKIHGVTKEVAIPFTYKNGAFSGKLSVNRFDYNVGEDTGTFMVGKEVEIEIIAVTN